MAKKDIISSDQEKLANLLFPEESAEETEEAILTIPPEKRVLRTEQYDFSVSTLAGMLEREEMRIPEFQRRYVWSDRQASRLIESLIIQCPVPVIYLNQEKDENFSVIDGNQRLRSIKRFLSNEFVLTGLTSYPELSGLKFSELDVRFQRHINNRVLRCTVILKETHPQVKFDVFERLNSGAVALTRQEIRHGLFYGPLLKKAAEAAKDIKLEGYFGSRKDKRMKAEELVIRYWALSEGLDSYKKPLATFLSDYAERNRSASSDVLRALSEKIKISHERVVKIFGDKSFVFTRNGRAKFNAAVFDAQMLACSGLSDKKFAEISKKSKDVLVAYDKIEKSDDYVKSVTLATSDEAALHRRVSKISRMLKSV